MTNLCGISIEAIVEHEVLFQADDDLTFGDVDHVLRWEPVFPFVGRKNRPCPDHNLYLINFWEFHFFREVNLNFD